MRGGCAKRGFVDGRERICSSKAIGELQYRHLPLLIGGVTLTVIQHGALRGMSAQQAEVLADEAKRDFVENAERRDCYYVFRYLYRAGDSL